MTFTQTDRPTAGPLDPEELRRIDAWWRAANYLSVGQIYLLDNPLLREPLRPEHVKPRLLGHWGTTPGLNFVYAHLNRVDRRARPRTRSTSSGRATAARAGRQHLAGGHLQRGLPDVTPGRGRACGGCSGSSRSPAASRATSRPRRRARSTRAASSGYSLVARLRRGVRQPGPGRRLRGRRRRGRDRAAGRELALATSSSTRPATARCCRSCTSTATRSPTRPCWPASRDDELRRAAAGLRLHARCSSTATTLPTCTRRWPPPSTKCLDEIAAIQRRRPRAAASRERLAGR